VVCSTLCPVIVVFMPGRYFLTLHLTPESSAACPCRTLRLTGSRVYRRSGGAACWMIVQSFSNFLNASISMRFLSASERHSFINCLHATASRSSLKILYGQSGQRKVDAGNSVLESPFKGNMWRRGSTSVISVVIRNQQAPIPLFQFFLPRSTSRRRL